MNAQIKLHFFYGKEKIKYVFLVVFFYLITIFFYVTSYNLYEVVLQNGLNLNNSNLYYLVSNFYWQPILIFLISFFTFSISLYLTRRTIKLFQNGEPHIFFTTGGIRVNSKNNKNIFFAWAEIEKVALQSVLVHHKFHYGIGHNFYNKAKKYEGLIYMFVFLKNSPARIKPLTDFETRFIIPHTTLHSEIENLKEAPSFIFNLHESNLKNSNEIKSLINFINSHLELPVEKLPEISLDETAEKLSLKNIKIESYESNISITDRYRYKEGYPKYATKVFLRRVFLFVSSTVWVLILYPLLFLAEESDFWIGVFLFLVFVGIFILRRVSIRGIKK